MAYQDDLFPMPAGFRPKDSRTEPLIWVKELRIYRVLAPGETNLLRRIELQPGLNILWARPRERKKSPNSTSGGVSGHATGKSTFCRFIRYILGESAFGTDEQRSRLRDKFPQAWVVGEVHLNGTPWLICRPFRVGGAQHVAHKGQTMEALFTLDGTGESFEEYRKELTHVLTEPLPVATFATSPTPIEWPHLIQWLTRDQECRFAGLAELRHSSSDSQSPSMTAEDTHFLFRSVLGLIDPTEQAEIENNKTLLKLKNDAERLAPLLRYRGASAYDRLRKRFPDFRQDLAPADFLKLLSHRRAEEAKSFAEELKAIQEPVSLIDARKAFYDAERQLHLAEQREAEVKRNLEWIKQQIRQLQGEITPSQLDQWLKDNSTKDHECGRSLAEAIEWECPLAIGRKLPTGGIPKPVPTKATQEQLEAQRVRENARLTQMSGAVRDHGRRVQIARDAFQNESRAYDALKSNLARQQAEDAAIADEAQRAYEDQIEADEKDASLKTLERNIRQSQDIQAQIRDRSTANLSTFSEAFARVARQIFDNDEVKSSVHFSGRKIRPTFIDEIDLTSAAIETLKFICFDLAALVCGVEGHGHHPGFLIHDGPREADLDADLYRDIFRMVHELEKSFGDRPLSFQYIVTTTEPPPEELQKKPWLIEPVLDATVLQGKLLGENF